MGGLLTCPNCSSDRPTSFNIAITGTQEKVTFAKSDDGRIYVEEAHAVTVNDYESEWIHCRHCGTECREEDLVEVDK